MSSSHSGKRSTTTDGPGLEKLEAALGYRFHDRTRLEQALTHRSQSRTHNERLEFLGDAVLGYVVAEQLFALRPDEKEDALSLIRASLVRRETLAEIAAELRLGDRLRMGAGERRSGGHRRPSLLADALEAVIGAVHEDGGIGAAREVIVRLLGERMAAASADAAKDPKTRLQELLQGANLPLPVYTVEEVTGAAHERTFRVMCRIDALGLAVSAEGPSRRVAETRAAAALLEQVGSLG
jgi:ribonuclease III